MLRDELKFGQQERAYHFPYHHVPHFDRRTGAGVTARALGWGLEYLCYTRHVLELTRELEPRSVLDVGCGDGRFLGLLEDVPRRVGVDPVTAAIRFARAFHPEVEFYAKEIGDLDAALEPFDLAVAIEVVEHLPPEVVAPFLRALASRVRDGGYVILSLPTPAARLLSKHHQHYDLETLRRRIGESGAPLVLQRAYHLCPRRPALWVRAALALSHNRWWQLDLYSLRKPLWRWIWAHRTTAPGEGRHLVVTLRKQSEARAN